MPAAEFDVAYVGHYTKDTIVTPHGEKTIDGGAFYYGCHVATRMGARAAVVTRLARQDFRVVDELVAMGVQVFARATPQSTRLRLVYPTDDLDQRTIYATGSAGPFIPEEVATVHATVFHVCASIRGEVPLAIVQALKAKGTRVSLDVQGFIRVNRGGELFYDEWPSKADVLRYVDVLKADSVEAETLTGSADLHRAARQLAEFGPREVLITHNGGVLALADGRVYEAPFVAREVRGRTGRGDTCTTAYLCKRLSAPPQEAVVWTAALTSLKLEAEGPFRRDVSEVEALIGDRYVSLVGE